jgi:predicted DNA-binding transcriptional regulator AlpA
VVFGCLKKVCYRTFSAEKCANSGATITPSNSERWSSDVCNLVDETEAAKMIGMSVAFLRAARYRGILGNRTPAPPHLEIGRAIRYDKSELAAWLAARRVDPTARRRAAETSSAA